MHVHKMSRGGVVGVVRFTHVSRGRGCGHGLQSRSIFWPRSRNKGENLGSTPVVGGSTESMEPCI